MTSLQPLHELHKANLRLKYPNLPEAAIASGKYKDSTANGLTKCVVAFITLSGGYATRVSTTGRMINKGTETRDKLVYIPGTTKRGTADIHAIWHGKHLSIEVKIGKDKQSLAQIETERIVNDAGGYYFIAKNFETFYNWITKL